MATQIVDLGYRARPQFIPLHARKQRWACVVAHRRAGKTVACLMDLIDAALRDTKSEPRYGYVAPFYAQAKDVAWSYLKRFTAPIPGAEHNESELRVDLPNGARIRLYGADNYDRMRGLYFDGVVIDEAGDMDPRAWPEVIRPALSDRKGHALFIGTPKGTNQFYEIFQHAETSDDWLALKLKASETKLIDADELADARQAMTEEQYEQEYECSFSAAIIGAYYGKDMAELERQGRITSVPWERSSPVSTSWDLGIDDATVVWFFQSIGREIRVIDYYEVTNQGLDETAKHVLSKPYLYDTHYLPHDIEIREIISAKSRRDTLESLGLHPIQPGVRNDPVERVNAVRMLLPRCVFDAAKCKRGIEVLKHYRREFDEKRKTFRSTPLHDWASHGADAFGEFAVNFSRQVARSTAPRRARIGTIA